MLLHFGKPQPPHDLKKPPLAAGTPSSKKRKMPFSRTSSVKDGDMIPSRTASAKDGDTTPSRITSAKDGIKAPSKTHSRRDGNTAPPGTHSSKNGHVAAPHKKSSKNGETDGGRPYLQKRNTLKGAFNRISTTLRRVRTISDDLSAMKSAGSTSDPKLDGHRSSVQMSVSEPCTRASMQAALGLDYDGASDPLEYQSKRPNGWYNTRRRLQGECNYQHGTCDWRTVPVFSDDDSIDMSRRALDLKKYWQSNPLRGRSSSTPGSAMAEERIAAIRTLSTGFVETSKKKNLSVDWKHELHEP